MWCRSAAHDRHSLVPPIVHEVLRSPGLPLDPATRSFMESRFGHNFGHVRIHTDKQAADSARAIDAQAYTVGQHVVLPDESGATANRALLAHELTHIVQQTAAGAAPGHLRIGAPDSTHEREAEAASQHVAAGDVPTSPLASSLASGVLQRQPLLPQQGLPQPSPLQGEVRLSIDLDKGQVGIIVIGPASTPVVPSPTAGLAVSYRRDPSGNFHFIVGSKDTIIPLNEIPQKLRDVVRGVSAPVSPRFQVPSCSSLRIPGWRPSANVFFTHDEWIARHKFFFPDIGNITRSLYDALVDHCREIPRPDKPPRPPMQDLPGPTLPPGEAYA